MQVSQFDVLTMALDALRQGHQATLVSVVNTYGTSPRPVGSVMVVCSNGSFAGSVSGGCIEEDLLQRLVAEPAKACCLERFGETPSEQRRLQLPCGGSLDVLLEPITVEHIEPLLMAIEQRQTLTRSVDIQSGEVVLEPFQSNHQVGLLPTDPKGVSTSHPSTPHLWRNVFGPVWRLLIVGAGETSVYLAEMAEALGYRVFVADPRPEYRSQWRSDLAELCEGYPDDVVGALKPDARTAVVTLSHDPKLDDLALIAALNSDAFFVGALGSQRTNANRRQRLQEHFHLSDQQLQRLHGPVGVPIGSKTPMEIALSVAAQLTAVRNGKSSG